MADIAEEDQAAERAHEKPFWASFTAVDLRTLVVTIAGTVIGGILLAMFVGVGVILARKWSGNPGGLGEAVGIATSVVVAWVAFGLLSVYLGRIAGRRFRVVMRRLSIGFFVVAGIYGLVLVLGVLGAAAGIR